MELTEQIINTAQPRDIIAIIAIAGLLSVITALLLLLKNRDNILREICKEVRESNALLRQIFPIIIYKGPVIDGSHQKNDR